MSASASPSSRPGAVSSRPGAASDPALSLPTATQGIPLTSQALASLGSRHALLLDADVLPADVEALAVSLDPHAGWVGASRLQLLAGVTLEGPFPLPSTVRQAYSLPDWAAAVMVLDCPPMRSSPLPPELAGRDPVADAFPLAQPEGPELMALTYLTAMARRLAGGLLLAGDGASPGAPGRAVLVRPDPASAVDLRVYAPIWLAPEACEAVLAGVVDGVVLHLDPLDMAPSRGRVATIPEEEMERLVAQLGADQLERAWRQARRYATDAAAGQGDAEGDAVSEDAALHVRTGYGLTFPTGHADGVVEVRVEPADVLPLAVAGQPWAGQGGVLYQLVWRPADPRAHGEAASRAVLRERDAAGGLIDRAAQALARAAGGQVLDEDGFLVDLSE